MLTLAELRSQVEPYQSEGDLGLIGRAYEYAVRAHEGQKRKSGDPYVAHPVAVAGTIGELGLDAASICAALLHDVVEDTETSTEDLARAFGTEIAFLVDGVTKLSKIDFLSRQDRQAESLRKMLVAMDQDIRVLVLKLCDRLDNMRTLEFMSPDGQARIAWETREIYAPLANRLGLAPFKAELQDLSFKFLEPEAYLEVQRLLRANRRRHEAHIRTVCKELRDRLARQGFAAEVMGRTKHAFSIWSKMQERKCTIEQVYDRMAFQVLVESIADCYAALGVIHSMWTPVPGRFKDYVALPKTNRYRSLHTTVFGPDRQRVELQIRTHEMHRVAEGGVIADGQQRHGRAGRLDAGQSARTSWLGQLMRSKSEFEDPEEFFESVRFELFQDELYAFTPKGDVRVFPRGATPIDFAYAIHTEIGDHCAAARVNAAMVPLGAKLHSGDLVEVMTDPKCHPHKEWLDWVVTSRARSAIRRYLRGQQWRKSKKLGQELLERALHRKGLSLARLEKNEQALSRLRQRYAFRRPSDLYVQIGFGKIKAAQVVDLLLDEPASERELFPANAIREGRFEALLRKVTGRSSHGIVLNGADDVLVRYTKCCNPVLGDEIVGFFSRGRGITVHRRECSHALDADPERRVGVAWDPRAKLNRPVKLTVTTADRPGILALVGQTFQKLDINISEATCRTHEDGRATNTFTFPCAHLAQLRNVIRKLQRIDGVMQVERR